MSIAVVCPACNAKLKAPEALIGKTVKCPGCATAVLIKAPAAVTKSKRPAEDTFEDLDDAPPPRKGAKSRKPADEIEDFEDITDEPPRKGKAKRKDDFEDITDEPPRKGKARARDEEDEDEDEDRPKKKKGREVPTGPTNDTDRTWGMLLHLSSLVVGFWGPVIIWFMKKSESKFVDWHFKAWVNFNITLFLIMILLSVIFGALGAGLMFVETWLGLIAFGLFGFIAFILGCCSLIFTIIAGLRAKNGIWYEYPMARRFWK